MTTTLTQPATSPFDLDALEASLSGPLAARRRAALASVRARGLPTARDEAWRFTSLSPIARGRFAAAPLPDAMTLASVEAHVGKTLGPAAGPRLVVVNGWLVGNSGKADPAVAWGGVASSRTASEALAGLVGELAGPDAAPFAALNLAGLQDAALVRVARGAVVREFVTVVHVTVAGAAPIAAFPRLVVDLEPGAQATVLEVHLPLDGRATPAPRIVHDGVTELRVGENARLEHVLVQLEDGDAARVHALQARVARDAGLGLHAVTLGGRLVRNDLRVLLDGEGAETRLRGLYLSRDEQHVDDHVFIDHATPHGTSDQVFKGVLAGTGHAVFDGQVHVREDAQKTSARQTNKNLLLSDRAVVNANPRLTIHADDVKCSHGATIGQLDPTALFYLRSRGIPAAAARGLLTLAFATEVVEALPASVRPWVNDLVRTRLAPDLREVLA